MRKWSLKEVKSLTQIACSLSVKKKKLEFKPWSLWLLGLCFHLNPGEWEYTRKIFFLPKILKSEGMGERFKQMMAMTMTKEVWLVA